MRIERIGRALNLVESEGNAPASARLDQPRIHLADTLGTELAREVIGAAHSFGRNCGIQLIGAPAHLHIQGAEFLVSLRQRRFKIALAHETPWANRIAHDIDGNGAVPGFCFVRHFRLSLTLAARLQFICLYWTCEPRLQIPREHLY